MNGPEESPGPPPEPSPAPQPETPASPAPEASATPGEPPVRPLVPDPWAHRRGEPRTFAALWLLFLFAATILSVGAVGIFGLMSTDVYRPAARVMLEIVAIGVVVLWPMVRLSQAAPAFPLRAMLGDAVVVLVPAQAVIW